MRILKNTGPDASAVRVGIADLKVSRRPDDMLVTYGLGSCIALCLHDPVLPAAGMIHYMMPFSRVAEDQGRGKPAMFADTGVPLLFEEMFELGCHLPDLIVKAAGGGSVGDRSGVLHIGHRNHAALRKLLAKNGIQLHAEDVGGARSRTVKLCVRTGEVVVSSMGREYTL